MDADIFEALYADCLRALQRLCYFKLPSRDDADDVLQEIALAAWARRESLLNPDAFRAWLMQIASNKIRDFYRLRAKRREIQIDETAMPFYTESRYGRTLETSVHDALETLVETDRRLLARFYLHGVPQAELSKQLGVPLGTVKSRLHTARERFKAAYLSEFNKGDNIMTRLPKHLPEYKITATDASPFECKWEELMGWFIVPKLGESLEWAMYDMPERKRTGLYSMKATGRAKVHGVEGVSLTAEIADNFDECQTREFVAQLSDTHARFLAESHMRDGIKHYYTFLDGDDFLDNWGFGEDNCGNSIYPTRRGIIERNGNNIVCPAEKFVLDVVDRCVVTLDGKEFDTIRIMDIECYNSGVVSEQFLDKNGRTVLWRRFNRDDWHIEHYGIKWSEKLPENERLIINGEMYVHWYDCVTDYIL